MRLENKVALISGGARGMGAEEARLFAREGAMVVIGDVLTEEGRATEAQINETGGQCVFVELDVTSESDWQNAVATAVSRFARCSSRHSVDGLARDSIRPEAVIRAGSWRNSP